MLLHPDFIPYVRRTRVIWAQLERGGLAATLLTLRGLYYGNFTSTV